ncbi:MAG: sigma 54-interacting transcriptional regulator [Planctomycetota bacterium]|jgi:Nif-specific regulatory protein
MALLRIIEGRGTNTEFVVDHPLVIGRGEEGDVRIFDETSSRRHAVVRPEGDRFVLEDLGSSNGTYLNGEQVAKVFLNDRDEILIGATRLLFMITPMSTRQTILLPPKESPGFSVQSSIREKDFRVMEGENPAEDIRRLANAYKTSRSLSGIREVDEIVEKTLDLMMEELKGDRAAVLKEAGTGEIEVMASRGKGRKKFVLSQTVVQQVARERTAVLIRDVESDPQFQGRESLLSQKVRSALCVPVGEGGKSFGMLYVDRTKSTDAFGREDLETLLAIGGQVGPALLTAEAFALERDRLRDVEKTLGGRRVLLGDSPTFREILDLIHRAAESDSTVLLRGETGTGKELLARALHLESERREGPFIAVNCAALVDTLLESELFGHEKGAFTGATRKKPGKFELSSGGTLFLDEVGEIAQEVQAKLLRAIQEKEFYRVGGTAPVSVDIRIVAATNKDLLAEVEGGRFRQDLYYRLSVVTIDVPPLRRRVEDIPALVEHAVSEANQKTKRKVAGVSSEAMQSLCGYAWPGNIRELINVIERAVVLSRGPEVGLDLLPEEIHGKSVSTPADGEVISLKEAERRAICAALDHTKWKKGETAEILGISWPTLNKKIEEYGIQKP